MLLRLCARLPSDLRSRTLPASSAPISPAKTLIPETGKPSTIPLTTFVARPQDLKQWPLLNQGLRRVLATRPMSLTYDQASDRRVAGSFRATLTNPSLNPSYDTSSRHCDRVWLTLQLNQVEKETFILGLRSLSERHKKRPSSCWAFFC